MSSIYSWDVTPANNASSDASIIWSEGQAPSTVNNSARAMMGRNKEFVSDIGGGSFCTGTATEIILEMQSRFTGLTVCAV
jgi:hypothetical protein